MRVGELVRLRSDDLVGWPRKNLLQVQGKSDLEQLVPIIALGGCGGGCIV